MNHCIEIALGAVAALAVASCEASPRRSGDDEPPLLLEDGRAPELMDSGADNSRCHVCHVDYVREDLAVVHARAGMGCTECHGDCDAHVADESWAWGGRGTPPEVMFLPERVNSFCMDCHRGDELSFRQHEQVLRESEGARRCTDCHGEHRLTKRKQDWKSARARSSG